MSKSVALYLHVHQPYRIRPYSVFEIGHEHNYFDIFDDSDANDERLLHRIADKSYRPMNALLLKLLERNQDFKLTLSITGEFIEQAERWTPDVLEDFKRLVDTGRVEILAETYYHSLAYFYSVGEFERQVKMHTEKIKEVFGIEPKAIRGTELAYNNEFAKWADEAGYTAVLAEGWEGVLDWRSPNYVYKPPETGKIKLLLKNYKLSDDLAFRFGDRSWNEWPLTADKYVSWVNSSLGDAPLMNLFMDYETFGEHQWEDTGIFTFFEQFIDNWSNDGGKFVTVTGAAADNEAVDTVSVQNTITWADKERDLTAWTGNSMQQEAARYLYSLEGDVIRSGDEELIRDWRYLQSSDHLYYMSTKWLGDGDVHSYFSPYDSPYDAFLYFMNVIRDMRWRVMRHHRIGGINDFAREGEHDV